jgi:ssRNA-specific RNase YbeY (16S rRNA maturation enzyme)
MTKKQVLRSIIRARNACAKARFAAINADANAQTFLKDNPDILDWTRTARESAEHTNIISFRAMHTAYRIIKP